MDELPKELLFLMGIKLDYRTVINWCRMSKKFRQICKDPNFGPSKVVGIWVIQKLSLRNFIGRLKMVTKHIFNWQENIKWLSRGREIRRYLPIDRSGSLLR